MIPPGAASLVHSMGVVWLTAAFGLSLAGMTTMIVVSPTVRGSVLALAWRFVLVRRVRRACVEAGIVTSKGKKPIVLSTSREPFGVGVRLWCRAGMAPEDFEEARGLFRTACWASDLRVRSDYRYPQLVTLEVVLPPIGLVPWTTVWR